QLSYPLNSENASPPGTCTVYLLCPVSCAVTARPPRTPSPTRKSVMTTPAASPLLLISALPSWWCVRFTLRARSLACRVCHRRSKDDHPISRVTFGDRKRSAAAWFACYSAGGETIREERDERAEIHDADTGDDDA